MFIKFSLFCDFISISLGFTVRMFSFIKLKFALISLVLSNKFGFVLGVILAMGFSAFFIIFVLSPITGLVC